MSRHIALVTNEIFPGTAGGIGRLVGKLAEELAADPFDVSVVFVGEPEALAAYRATASQQVSVYHVDDLFAASGADDIPLWAFQWTHYHNAYRVAQALRHLHATRPLDLIEYPDFRGLGYVALKERRLLGSFDGVTMLVRLHGTTELTLAYDDRVNHRREHLQLEDMERYCLRHADSWVAPSKSLATWYEQHYGIVAKGTTISVPPFEVMPSVEKSAPSAGALRVLFYGKMQHLKGVDVIVDAFVEARRAGANVILTLVGGDTGEGAESHQAFLERRIPAELSSFVTFKGRIDPRELPHIAAAHDVAVVASRIETFCLAAHELNGLAIPLILPDIAAFKDFFADGRDSLFFDGSSASLAKLLLSIVGERTILSSLTCNRDSVASRVHVLDDYRAIERPSAVSAGEQKPVKVSIVIPYDEMHATIDQTLASVFRSHYRDFEIIIVDDGSRSAEALAKLEELRAKHRDSPWLVILDKPHGGLGSARNYGVRAASGEVVLPLDGDAVIDPELLGYAVTSLSRNPELAAVSFLTSYFADGTDPATPVDYVIPHDLNRLLILLENRAGTATSAFRRSVLVRNPYDETLTSYEDWNLWWRLAETGDPVEVVPRLCFRHRRRAHSPVSSAGSLRYLEHLSRMAGLHPQMLTGAAPQVYLAQTAMALELRAENVEVRQLLEIARQEASERAELADLEASTVEGEPPMTTKSTVGLKAVPDEGPNGTGAEWEALRQAVAQAQDEAKQARAELREIESRVRESCMHRVALASENAVLRDTIAQMNRELAEVRKAVAEARVPPPTRPPVSPFSPISLAKRVLPMHVRAAINLLIGRGT